MEPVDNPLHSQVDGASPKPSEREVPRVSNQKHQQQSRRAAAGGQCVRALRTFVGSIPWIVVLGVAILIAALVTGVVFMDSFVISINAFLTKLKTSIPDGVVFALDAIKGVLIAFTSFIGALVLLLGVLVKRQGSVKKASSNRAGWPHGRSNHLSVTLGLVTATLLWLMTVFYIALLCVAVFTTAMAWTAREQVQEVLSLQPNGEPRAQLQQLKASLGNAKTAFVNATNNAPAVIKQAPWFKTLDEKVLPLLQPKPDVDAGDITCPPTCLDLKIVAVILQQKARGNANSCLCLRATLEEAESQLDSIIRDGLAVMVCLAVLTIMATWLMVYCNVACVSIRRDLTEATYDKQHGNVLLAVEAPTGVNRTADDLGQEGSPLPLKGKWGAAAAADVARQDDRLEKGQLSDVERPA